MGDTVGRRLRRARLFAVGVSVALILPSAPATVASGGQFLPYRSITVPSEADAIAIGDVTGDGRDDIVATTGYDFDPAHDFHLLVIAQSDDGSLLPPVLYETAGSYTQRPGSVDIGDVDGDGRADVVVGLDRYGIQVFPGTAAGTLGDPTLTLSTDSTRIRVGRLDDDGTADVAGIGWGSDTVTTFSDAGAGLVATATHAAVHNGWDDLEVADVTGDGLDDLIVMSGQGFGPNLSILARLAGGGFGPATEYSLYQPENTHGIGVGDTNGDGRNDIVASYGGNYPSSRVALWVQLPDGSLDLPVIHNSYDIPEPVEVADLDLDGQADVVTLHGGWLRAGVYRGRADATLQFEELYEIPYASHYSVHGLAIGDVNGDGWPDVVAADYNNGLIVLSNSAVVVPTEPGPPTLESAAPGDGQVSLAWTPPGDDGGAPISYYLATASPGGAYCFVSALGCTIAGLVNNTAYSFTVRASNDVGIGPPSNALSTTPGVAPSAPSSLATSPNLAAGIGLSWQAPASPGSTPISGYRIYRGIPGAALLPHAVVGPVLTYTDTAVVNGGQYAYQVAALNGFGEGPRSAQATAQRGTAPSAPRSVTAASSGKGITIGWSSPATTSGSSVTTYRVYRGTVAGGAKTLMASVASGVTSYIDKATVRKTRYYYWITAVNVLGESVPSTEVTAVAR